MSLSFVKQVWKQIEAYTNILCIWTAVSDTVFKIWQGFHHNMPNTTLEFDVWKIYRSHNSTTGAICCLHVIFVSRVSHPFFFFTPQFSWFTCWSSPDSPSSHCLLLNFSPPDSPVCSPTPTYTTVNSDVSTTWTSECVWALSGDHLLQWALLACSC